MTKCTNTKQVLIKSKKISNIFKHSLIIVLHLFLFATVFLYVSMQLLAFLFLFFFLSMTTRLALQITFMRFPPLQVRSDLTI